MSTPPSATRGSGDLERTAALIWRIAPAYLGSGRPLTISRWLDGFTLDEIAAQPALAITAAWACMTGSRHEPIGQWTELARRSGPDVLLPDGTPLGAMLALLEAMTAPRGVTRMIEDAGYACEHDRPDSPYLSIGYSVAGTGLRLSGAPDRARAVLERGVAHAALVPGSLSTCLCDLALLAIADDDWSEARRNIDRAIDVVVQHELTERPPQAGVFATSALVHAQRGATADARHDAMRARFLLTRLDYAMPWMAIEARLVLARAELILGDVEAARVLETESLDLLRHFPDAGALAEDQETLAKAIQAAAGEVGQGVVPLTTAELRVLRYLPTHLSFQAIAEELFVSRNTVKTQAIAIYRKLGVSSRGDAVAAALELGLLEA